MTTWIGYLGIGMGAAMLAASVNATKVEDLQFGTEPCAANCLMEVDGGTYKLWFYVDAQGHIQLDAAQHFPETASKEPIYRYAAIPLVDGSIPPQHDAVAVQVGLAMAEGAECGTDGWGWLRGELVSRLVLANDTEVWTQYSHAGQAIRTTVQRDSDSASEPQESGIKSGTPESCSQARASQ